MRVGIDARKIADFGIGTYIRGLLGALDSIGGDEEYVVFAPESSRDLVPRRFEFRSTDAPHYSIREHVIVGRAVAVAKVDVMHFPHYVVAPVRGPVVATIHDLIHLHQPQRNLLAPIYARLMLGRAMRRCARILTVSDAVRDDLIATFPDLGEKIVVTPNGVDPFPADVAREPGRYFLFVGNDKAHKNVATLLEAMSIIRRTRPEVRLRLTGGSFERYADRDGVERTGFVSRERLASLYRGAIALVLPSVEEGFGLPALEAMSCRTAVITSKAPALVEVTGDAALHVEATSPSELAAAMLRVADDPALAAELGRRGVARAAQFTWQRCAKVTREIYFALASQR